MDPIQDADIQQRYQQALDRVRIDQENVDRWTVEQTYWTGKKDARLAADVNADTTKTDAYLTKVGGYVTNTEGHLAASTAERDELQALMAENSIPTQAPGG